MRTVHEIVRDAERGYLYTNTKMGKYVDWSMHNTIETIDAYLNSKHTSGSTDSLGREKPFFNIVTSAVSIWWRATDIDRKDIRFIPQKASSVVLAFIAGVLLQKWMDENDFGSWLNQWGRSLARYGSSVPKFVEKGDKLTPTIIPWNRIIADPIDFNSIPHIEKFYKTSGQLRNMATKGHPDYAGYDMEAVNAFIEAASTRKTLDKFSQDTQPNFIEVYEAHGLLEDELLKDEPDLTLEPDEVTYVQQMHAIGYCVGENDGEYQDFTLYCGKEALDPYEITHLIEEDGRTLSIGAVEYLFDAQWMQNHTMKQWKDQLDLSSKLIFQTADQTFAGRNVLSAIETGDILVHSMNMPLELVPNSGHDITNLQAFGQEWNRLAQDVTSTPDAMRGITLPSATAYRQAALLSQAANSFFELMTENKGLALERLFRKYVIPHLKKQLKHKDEVVGILDDAGIKEIDSYYIPRQAIKNYNDRTTKQLFDNARKVAGGQLAGPLPPFDPNQEQQAVQQQMGPLGNKRFFKPDEFDKQTWAELLGDFEWDNIKVEVTNENTDKQAVLQTLTTVLQTLATNPMILQDPNAKMVFAKILEETATVSPLELAATQAPPPPQQQQMQGAAPAPPPGAAAPANVRPVRQTAAALIG